MSEWKLPSAAGLLIFLKDGPQVNQQPPPSSSTRAFHRVVFSAHCCSLLTNNEDTVDKGKMRTQKLSLSTKESTVDRGTMEDNGGVDICPHKVMRSQCQHHQGPLLVTIPSPHAGESSASLATSF
ncbi:unnamed protein product [Pleuronectes platessa]|uniref:Uncharacterized protein n=1 Tax=Pleuronectes platessa TaxID=8262 RepID=A0A9N7UV02_PLEPL|nr:unnamed protein product [Pleuronectes platessa]